MPTRITAAQRGADRARSLLRRYGEELNAARMTLGLSSREVGRRVGISHTQVIRIERGYAPHVDVAVLARLAAAVGHELSMRIHPVATAVRDAGHVALLARFAMRLAASVGWRTEVAIPLPGDARSADGVLDTAGFDAVVEAETRLYDLQATERRLRAKQRDLATTYAILLVADTRHNRAVIAGVPELSRRFPVGTRACLAALAKGRDPGGDCLLVM
jgi:transcriptional regulator with XRE-family HTH domain